MSPRLEDHSLTGDQSLSGIDLVELSKLTEDELEKRARKSPEWFQQVCSLVSMAAEADQKDCQIAYYRIANPRAIDVHKSTAREIAVVGGNRSSKTDTMLAELAIQMTGHIPQSLWGIYPKEKIRAPIRARIVCNSLTDTLEPVIKPKLRYDTWNGVGEPKEGRGHWGWIPRHCLPGGTWEKAYSEKYRTLTVSVDSFWNGPNGEINKVTGYSQCQFLSYDQDLTAFAGSSMHLIGHDELPPADIYRENRMRTLDVKGQIITSFTPPDEAGQSRADVAWFFDEVYERGLPGPGKHPNMDTFILWTEHNRILSVADVDAMMSTLTEEQRETRQHGKFIHLSGIVFSLFTERESWWCFRCQKKILPVGGTCVTCTGDNVGTFSHVIEPFQIPQNWPIIFVIDPHPRKKDAMGWFAITPSDDIIQIHEMELDGTAIDVAREIRKWEEAKGVSPVKRLMDPNIATETNDKLQRGWTMRRAYDDAGIRCDLATDDLNTGIECVNELLKPDPRTRKPRFSVFATCARTIKSLQRFSWDEWTRQGDRDPKERVRDKFKDFADVVRYMAADRPSFHGYTKGFQVFRMRRG